MTQSSAAAERSAHVTRGKTEASPSSDPFVGPEYGPIRLKCVVDTEERALIEINRLRVLLGFSPLEIFPRGQSGRD